MVINAWVLSKHMSNDNSNWRWTRLFDFKMAIAKMMLWETKSIERRVLKILGTRQQSSESDDDENDFNPPKKKRKRNYFEHYHSF